LRRRTSGSGTGEGLERRLAEDQLDNARQLQRTANVVIRLAGLLLVGGVIAGIALMVHDQSNPLCDPSSLRSTCDEKNYPYFGDGLALLVSSLISAFLMVLVAQWARMHATAQLMLATKLLAPPNHDSS
jgi:hypothetical protein